jgi:Ca-activated chloride channel family protein
MPKSTFSSSTSRPKPTAHLWARRKVGFLLDQIRINGEQKELVEEATKLAKKYGIATPYTSYLVVPDAPVPVAERGRGSVSNITAPEAKSVNAAFAPAKESAGKVAAANASAPPAPGGGGLAGQRGAAQDKALDERLKELKPEDKNGEYAKALEKTRKDNADNLAAGANYKGGRLAANQAGTLGVDLAVASNQLRNQERISITANRAVQGRNCVEIAGVWIDDAYEAKTPTVKVKAQSDAYFKLLEKHPELKEVYLLGNHFVWIAPSGQALVVDAGEGKETIEDKEIESLFTAKK